MESPRTLVHESLLGAGTPQQGGGRRRIARGSEQAHEREPGAEDLILGRYRLAERLGAGGFGVVWRAQDELLHRDVAVKRIWLGPDGDGERASREALATARLAHPAIVALYEACAVDDAFYLISELIDGRTLAQLIAAEQLGDGHVIAIGRALTAALAHAHERGVIHRDIKPQNVLVLPLVARRDGPSTSAPAAKLTDFGGASLVGEDALTRTGDVLGTLAYMAPEQSEGHGVDERADLYSLALVLYEALAGVNPVRGATPAATVRRIGRPIESLERQRRDLPVVLLDAIDGALERRPRDRGTLEELDEALAQAAEECEHDDAEHEADEKLTRRVRRRADAEDTAQTRRRAAPAVAPVAARRATAVGPASRPRRRLEPSVAVEQPTPLPPSGESHAEAPAGVERGIALPRTLWIAVALLGIGWQAWIGHAGVSLLVLAAVIPLAALPRERRSRRVGAGWLVCALAPALGMPGLAAAYPALAGQALRWRDRAVRGAIGYWWLLLAEPLLGRRLWLGAPSGLPARAVWEGSIQQTAAHLIVPLFTLAVLLGALLWALAATALPWLLRGRNAILDLLAAGVWSVALVLATPALDAGLASQIPTPAPRGLLLGTVLAGFVAVGARALRGPV